MIDFVPPYDITRPLDKPRQVRVYIRYFLNRLLTMHKYGGLPETIPQRNLELMLLTEGFAGVCEHNDELYAFNGGIGGEPNPYYMPTKFIVANPALKLSKEFTIDSDCVIFPNDSTYSGLMPLLSRYAHMMVEADITMRTVLINSRVPMVMTAKNDQTKQSAELFLKNVEEGKLAIIGDNIMDMLNTLPYGTASNASSITDIIEAKQYITSSLYNEIGLNANYNMKREAINSEEAQMNHDALYPLIDDMTNSRKNAVEKINAMFGTSITVERAGIWKEREEVEEVAENPGQDAPVTED